LGQLVHLPGESHDEDGEGTERPAIALREREPRRAEPRREREPVATDAFWDGGEEPELDGNDQDLDILHHPSYQERNRSNQNRRRRNGGGNRREGFNREGTSKAAPWEETNRYSPAPAPTKSEYPTRADAPIRAEYPAPVEYDLELEEAPPVEETFTPREREPRFSEERRGRSRRGSMKPVLDPPEVIHVEMSPEEQDVYAWMGISPLILTDKEVKNPKSAIVAVTLPGEAPPAIAATAEPVADAEDEEEDLAVDAPDEIEFGATPPAVADEPAEPELAASDESEPPRRRRRRSSAVVAD
jgi:ribonuclease E